MKQPGLRFVGLLLTLVGLVVAACSGDSDGAPDAGAPSAARPALSPGVVTTGSVEVTGTTIDYVVFVPADFTIGDQAPVLLAFPPGGQDIELARGVVESTYAPEAARLGWVVISPAAPGGQLYFQGSETLVPGLLDWVETWVTPEGGGPHVAGVSNGGISAFRYAALNPDRVRSVVVLPGFPRSEDDQAALSNLTEVPIRMFVGGTDTGWVQPAQETVETVRGRGGDIELTIFEGEGHILTATRDGRLIFDQLESFR